MSNKLVSSGTVSIVSTAGEGAFAEAPSEGVVPIRLMYASVTDKSGLGAFVRRLSEVGTLRVLSSGGTAEVLREGGAAADDISEYTGFPECFGGRVKTLHPRVAGGILFRRGTDDEEAVANGVEGIDLVVCNFYDFASAAADPEKPTSALLEAMDIGGPTVVRSAVKNYASVAVVTDPADYDAVAREVEEYGGVTLTLRQRLAAKAIAVCADYEAALAEVLSKRLVGKNDRRISLVEGRQLRYGENPDQPAWVYGIEGERGIVQGNIVSGKALSFNNYEDSTAAYDAVRAVCSVVNGVTVAVVKHGSLCGYASGKTLPIAFERGWEGDAKSAFGSVIGIGTTVDEALIPCLQKRFIEVIVASGFTDAFVEWCRAKKPNLRLLAVPLEGVSTVRYKHADGGVLAQAPKQALSKERVDGLFQTLKSGCGVATKAQPLDDKGLYAFAIAAVSHAKSNAVAVVRAVDGGYQLVGMGAGQPNRIDSLERLAIPKARDLLLAELGDDARVTEALSQCVLGSDGFFPFEDSIRSAAECGISSCVQPGGSKRDGEVVAAADELSMSMIMTGERYFSH